MVIALFTMTTQSYSQIKFGVRAGLNLADMSLKETSGMTEKMNTSFHVGGIAEYSLSESLSVEAGLLLSGKGKKMEYSEPDQGVSIGMKVTIAPLYLEVPINAVFKVDLGSAKLQLFAGPYLAYGIAGKAKYDYTASGLPSGVTLSSLGFTNESTDIKFGTKDDSDMKATDFGLNIGAGVEMNNMLVRLQYGLGLSNLDPAGSSSSEMKNKVIGISVGYMFGEKAAK